MTNTDEKAQKMERHLLQTQFPMECEELPLDELQPDERDVVIKCMEHEDLTDDEFTLLKKTLVRYRKAIHKHKPSETVEAFEKVNQMITTEQEWLDLLDNEEAWTLRVNVPFDGEWYPMKFKILPLDDSSVVSTLQLHVDLFKDYTRDEMLLWNKAQQGQIITPEEKQIVDKMAKEIEEKNSEERISSMNNFLAAQLRLPDSSSDFKLRLKFWEKFPFIVKSAIMFKVEDKLGLTDQSNEKLFPTG